MDEHEITAEALAHGAAASPAGPCILLNLLRYRDKVEQFPGESGREVYRDRYVPAFQRLTREAGVELLWLGKALASIAAPAEERWHDIALVQYPSFAAFRHIVESEAYRREADPFRKAALADFRLILANQIGAA